MKGIQINVLVTSHVLTGAEAKDEARVPARLCTGSRNPCSIVDNLEIRVNGKNVFVPKSAYLGLTDAITATISEKNGRYALYLTGGDASEAYKATFNFDDNRVFGRTISPATAPASPLKETIFNIVTTGD